MGNKRKRTRNRRGMQVVTLCISTTMVLIFYCHGDAEGLCDR